eukprot:469431-Rhodomonas_salina.1
MGSSRAFRVTSRAHFEGQRVRGPGLGLEGSGLRAQGIVLLVQGSGSRVQGLRLDTAQPGR